MGTFVKIPRTAGLFRLSCVFARSLDVSVQAHCCVGGGRCMHRLHSRRAVVDKDDSPRGSQRSATVTRHCRPFSFPAERDTPSALVTSEISGTLTETFPSLSSRDFRVHRKRYYVTFRWAIFKIKCLDDSNIFIKNCLLIIFSERSQDPI